MKKIVAIVFVIFMSVTTYAQNADQVLGNLINAQNYWSLEKELRQQGDKASDFVRLMSEGLVGYHFNRPRQAIESLSKLLNEHKDALDANGATLGMAILLAECYGLAGEYKNAAGIYGSLVAQLEAHMNVDSVGYRAQSNKFSALSETQPQKMIRGKTTVIPTKTDSVGLITVPVTIGGHTLDLVFDTGAGYSLIPEEYARQMGVKILDVTVEVRGFSVIPMKLGIAEKMRIGDAEFENIIFIINAEKFIFPQAPNYEIKGIIGLYTMFTMGEVEYNKKRNTITIPKKPRNFAAPNMMQSDLHLFTQAITGTDTMTMDFDSGAVTGGLTSSYYEKHKDFVMQNGKLDSINMGGIGGHIKGIPVYIVNQFPLQVGKKKVIIPKIEIGILANPSSAPFHGEGVIGQDYMQLFNKTIINFNDMNLTFD